VGRTTLFESCAHDSLERLACLRSTVVELAGLADDDGTSSDDCEGREKRELAWYAWARCSAPLAPDASMHALMMDLISLRFLISDMAACQGSMPAPAAAVTRTCMCRPLAEQAGRAAIEAKGSGGTAPRATGEIMRAIMVADGAAARDPTAAPLESLMLESSALHREIRMSLRLVGEASA
jgi:hypothetical protein